MPTLYFNYLLDAGINPANLAAPPAAAAQVYASSDNGATWHLLATNQPSQLPKYISVSSNTGSGDPAQGVQPLFNATTDTSGNPVWRQARVDLSAFAGDSNIKLKFNFASGTANNNHKGFSIDDIIVGLASRGEMVTQPPTTSSTPAPSTAFFPLPQNPNPNAPSQVLVGAYELSIRRGQEYATSANGSNAISLTQQLTPNGLAPTFSLIAPSAFALVVPDPPTLIANGQTFTISDGTNSVTFEFADYGVATLSRGPTSGPVGPNHVGIALVAGESATDLTRSILQAINGQTSSTFKVGAFLDASGTKLYLAGAASVNTASAPFLTYAPQITNGDTFTLSDGTHSLTFQFEDASGSVPTGSGHIAVPFTASDSPQTIAANILKAINAQTGATFAVSASIKDGTDRAPFLALRLRATASTCFARRSSTAAVRRVWRTSWTSRPRRTIGWPRPSPWSHPERRRW